MKTEEYDAIVKKLEVQAAQDPKGYVWHVTKLALLGYAYIFGLIVFLLAMVAFFLWLVLVSHYVILVKFSFLFLIAAWLVAKSLWVKFSDPVGIPLRREDSPLLFDLIAEITAAAGGPKIHSVILTEEFNCAVMQTPRLGIFGWYKNILILGLPLLQSVNLPQFKAIMAHEMGHLSDQHGKVGCWIYHVRKSWQQTVLSLAYQSSIGIGLIKVFAEWFVPLFDAHTYVLMREHEYAADRIAANVAGAECASQALIQTALKGSFLADEYWKNYWNKVEHIPEPPNDTFSSMTTALRVSIDDDKALELLQKNWAKHDGSDTHPSLSERVRALQPDKDWSNPQVISSEAARQFHVDATAAEQLFGNALPNLEAQVEIHWRNAILNPWAMRHLATKEARQRLNKIEDDAKERDLKTEEMLELAGLSLELDEPVIAIQKYRSILEKLPDEAEIHFGLGLLLLGEKDNEGIERLENAAKLKPVFGRDSYAHISAFLRERGKEEEAQVYYKKSIALDEEMYQASHTLNSVSNKDTFEAHKLTEDELDKICNSLANQNTCVSAYVVAKKVPEIVGGHQHILLLNLKGLFGTLSSDRAQEVLDVLCVDPAFAGFYLMTWPAAPKSLTDAVESLPTAKVFDKSKWEKPDTAPGVSHSASLAQSYKPPSFYSRHKSKIMTGIAILIVLGLVSGFVLSIFRESHNRTEERSTSIVAPRSENANETLESNSSQSARFGHYMSALQTQIKQNWVPPHASESGTVVVRFKIRRDGTLAAKPIVSKSSGMKAVDTTALLAVRNSAPFYPLPTGAPPEVDIDFTFDFKKH